MESFFSFSTLFNLVLTVIWFISGIRDQPVSPRPGVPRLLAEKERRVLHAQQHRLSDLSLHTCYIADLPYPLRHCNRGRPSLSCRLRKLEP